MSESVDQEMQRLVRRLVRRVDESIEEFCRAGLLEAMAEPDPPPWLGVMVGVRFELEAMRGETVRIRLAADDELMAEAQEQMAIAAHRILSPIVLWFRRYGVTPPDLMDEIMRALGKAHPAGSGGD